MLARMEVNIHEAKTHLSRLLQGDSRLSPRTKSIEPIGGNGHAHDAIGEDAAGEIFACGAGGTHQ